MRQLLTPEAIIHLGYHYEVRAYWERVCAVTAALFGAGVGRVTLSLVDTPVEDHFLGGVQIVATDATGQVLPYDFTTAWWAQHGLGSDDRTRYATAHLADLAASAGSAFPPALGAAVRALCEEQLGLEFFQQWAPQVSRTWTFDCQSPPAVVTHPVFTAAGDVLDVPEIMRSGREHAAHQRWVQVRQFVQTLYGPRAATTQIVFFSRYNDVRYDRDLRLVVRDRTGSRLYYDLLLPWWQRHHFSEDYIANYDLNHEGELSDDYEGDAAHLDYYEDERPEMPQNDVRRLAQILLRVSLAETEEHEDADSADFDFDQPPPLTYPQLWQADV